MQFPISHLNGNVILIFICVCARACLRVHACAYVRRFKAPDYEEVTLKNFTDLVNATS